MAIDIGITTKTISYLLYLYGVSIYKVEENGQDGGTILIDEK